MGRRTEQVARTRAQIVYAAMALYRERGIRATSMSEVARGQT
jgi:AcrR family transcriptional regulator